MQLLFSIKQALIPPRKPLKASVFQMLLLDIPLRSLAFIRGSRSPKQPGHSKQLVQIQAFGPLLILLGVRLRGVLLLLWVLCDERQTAVLTRCHFRLLIKCLSASVDMLFWTFCLLTFLQCIAGLHFSRSQTCGGDQKSDGYCS